MVVRGLLLVESFSWIRGCRCGCRLDFDLFFDVPVIVVYVCFGVFMCCVGFVCVWVPELSLLGVWDVWCFADMFFWLLVLSPVVSVFVVKRASICFSGVSGM